MQKVGCKLILVLCCCLLLSPALLSAEKPSQISTIDFVKIVNGHSQEALFYYQQNWLVLRKQAKQNGFIQSFELQELQHSHSLPFDLMLVTTYQNATQYAQRESNFELLLQAAGELRLKNKLKPSEFRKVLYSPDSVTHWH